MFGAEGGDGSCGSVGDAGGEVVIVVGLRRAATNEEVAAERDENRAVLCVRKSEVLDFGGIGLGCKALL